MAAGSTVAVLQSAGAAGLSMAANAVVATGGAVAATAAKAAVEGWDCD